MLKENIEKLSSDFNLQEPLAPNDDGSYSLYLEPDLHILLRETPGSGITVFTYLGSLPEVHREEFLLKAMIANLLGRETGGSCLGLDKGGTKVAFLNFLPMSISYREFHDFLEDFVNYADVWRQEIVQFIENQSE